MAQVSRGVIFTYMFLMLVFGTANTMVGKLMDMTKSDGRNFQHPYFQTAVMFVGELLCLGIYQVMVACQKKPETFEEPPLIMKAEEPQAQKGLAGKIGKFVFGIPAFFDTCASTLMFVGLVLSASSVYQMVRGFIVVVVALYSKVFLKRRIFRHQILGVAFVFIGVTLVGISSILYASSTAENPELGIIILIIAQFGAGGVFVSEEKFLRNIVVHPMQAVGIEGLCGFGYYLILLIIFQFIPCHNGDLCSGGHVEDTPDAFKQLGSSALLLILIILFALSIAFFNWTGVTTTKYASALARSTIDTSRTLLVWVISMIVGWEEFNWLQLIGFVILTFGTMVYNEVIILPWWGFKESVTKHRAYAKIIHGGSPDDDGAEYLAQSPAIYDSSRQDRKNSALMRTMNNDLIMKDDI